jgi:hypothetical protein
MAPRLGLPRRILLVRVCARFVRGHPWRPCAVSEPTAWRAVTVVRVVRTHAMLIRPTTREGRRRLVELRAILKIRSTRNRDRLEAQKELAALLAPTTAAPAKEANA